MLGTHLKLGLENMAGDAGDFIPGYNIGNALHGLVTSVQRTINSQPTPQTRTNDAAAARAMRRARLAAQLQNDAVRSGRARLSENEVNAHLSTMGY